MQVPDGVFQRPSSSTAWRWRCSAPSRRWAAGSSPAARASPPKASSTPGTAPAASAVGAAIAAATSARPSIRRPPSSIPPATAATSRCGPYSVVSEVFLDEATGRAAGVRVIDANTKEVMEFRARVVVLGAGTLDSTRILLNSQVGASSRRAGELLGHPRLLPERARHGPPGQRLHPVAHRQGGDPRRRPAVGPTCRGSATSPTSIPTSSAATTSRAGAARASTRTCAHDLPGFGKAFKSSVRKYYPAMMSLGGFGEVLPRKENRVSLDPW